MLQPCDGGINKSLKARLKQCASDWRRERHASLGDGEKLARPTRKEILLWLLEIWEQFPTEIVKYSFTASGYVFEDGVDYTVDTESESEVDIKLTLNNNY